MQRKGIRIQKVLSEGGILSRRKAEEYIAAGRVTVNGHPAQPGNPVDPARDIIAIDGQRVEIQKKKKNLYLMLYKPRGYVTTLSDELGRRCVADLVQDVPSRVYPVGRLDRDSEGLLLLTNDGAFSNAIMHPSNHIGKTYRVTVRPTITEEQLTQLSVGVEIEEGVVTQPAQVYVLDKEPGRVVLQITIFEGRNRQIRRMCEAVGLEVARLKRTSIGPIRLGMLQPGQWRELAPVELNALRMAIQKKGAVEETEERKPVKKPTSQRPARTPQAGGEKKRPASKKPASPRPAQGPKEGARREGDHRQGRPLHRPK